VWQCRRPPDQPRGQRGRRQVGDERRIGYDALGQRLCRDRVGESGAGGEMSRAAAARSSAMSASGFEGTLPSVTDTGLVKGPRDLELSPWHKGRYGTAIGRAVHGVLQ
jgi:hypothetical protein